MPILLVMRFRIQNPPGKTGQNEKTELSHCYEKPDIIVLAIKEWKIIELGLWFCVTLTTVRLPVLTASRSQPLGIKEFVS